jgi:hypothetical protein
VLAYNKLPLLRFLVACVSTVKMMGLRVVAAQTRFSYLFDFGISFSGVDDHQQNFGFCTKLRNSKFRAKSAKGKVSLLSELYGFCEHAHTSFIWRAHTSSERNCLTSCFWFFFVFFCVSCFEIAYFISGQ